MGYFLTEEADIYDADSRIDWRYRILQSQEVNLPSYDATYDIDNRVATWNVVSYELIWKHT